MPGERPRRILLFPNDAGEVRARKSAAASASAEVASLQIGEVARRVDLSIRTIRHWEEVGLVTPSARSSGGFRLYSEDDVARIRLLRFMKPLDLSLDQMRELMRIRDQLTATTADPSHRVEALVWPRTSHIEADRAELTRQLAEYADLAARRLDKLRRYVEEVEEFRDRLSTELADGTGEQPSRANTPT